MVGWLCWGLTSQSTIFQSCRDGAIAPWVINQFFRGVKCLAQGHNTATVGLEPRTSRSGVRHSTTEPPHSPPTPWFWFTTFCQIHIYHQELLLSCIFFAIFDMEHIKLWLLYSRLDSKSSPQFSQIRKATLCERVMCLSNPCCSWNWVPHISHRYGLYPVWERRWRSRWLFQANDCWQYWQV